MTRILDPWPFPGMEPELLPELPPARFALGDRVITRWGAGTVCWVGYWGDTDMGRKYIVHHDWSNAPATFGHGFYENDLVLLEQPATAPRTKAFQRGPAPMTTLEQLHLF